MRPSTEARSPLRTAHITKAFGDWLRGNGGEHLVDAAELLGGPKCAGRAQNIVDDVAAGAPLGATSGRRRTIRKLS